MNRLEAIEYLKSKLKNKNLIRHSLAVEACMERLAEKFSGDADIWELAGFLHPVRKEAPSERGKRKTWETV